MTATIINSLMPRLLQRRSEHLLDQVTQAVMETFKPYPLTAIADGIEAARITLDCGESIGDAMEAAEKTIMGYMQRHMPDAEVLRNNKRLELFYHRRARRTAAFLSLIERQLHERLASRPEAEIAAAAERARRVLAGGGTLCAAMRYATGDDQESAAC